MANSEPEPAPRVEWRVNVAAIDRARVLKGWTHADLARSTWLARPTVSDMLSGRRRPSLGTVDAVRRALGLEMKDAVQFREVSEEEQEEEERYARNRAGMRLGVLTKVKQDSALTLASLTELRVGLAPSAAQALAKLVGGDPESLEATSLARVVSWIEARPEQWLRFNRRHHWADPEEIEAEIRRECRRAERLTSATIARGETAAGPRTGGLGSLRARLRGSRLAEPPKEERARARDAEGRTRMAPRGRSRRPKEER